MVPASQDREVFKQATEQTELYDISTATGNSKAYDRQLFCPEWSEAQLP